MSKTVAEVFIETLIAAGVHRIYGASGDSRNAFIQVVHKRNESDGDIDWLLFRHEETAAYAAGAHAELTGSLAVCAGSCGPGNLHLISGLFDCQRSRVPVLAIATQIPSSEIGTGYFQETHPEHLFKDCSHFCEFVSSPEQLPRVLAIAMRTAIAQRGVAVIVIPGDLAFKEAVSPAIALGISAPAASVCPSFAELEHAAEILNKAKNITILGGAGCQSAHAELLATAERLKAPIVHALRGKPHIEYDNPYDVGMTGLIGFPSGFHALKDCDALLMLGTDFPYPQFYPKEAKIIQVDLRGENIGRRTPVTLGLIGHVQGTLAALLPLLDKKRNRSFLDKALAHYKDSRKELDSQAIGEPGRTPIHPQYVAKLVDELASEDAIFTCDVGTPTVWAARYLTMNGKRHLLGSFNHGSMANALPQAIGAQSTYPARQVIALSGDGGLSMLLGDLLTLPQYKLPVKVIVFSNGALAFVEMEMKAIGLLNYATELQNPDFARLAESAGILGLRVEKPEDLRPALQQALAHPGPALVEVIVNRQELSMPPTITPEQAKGFSLYMLRAVLSGNGKEVLDLAKSNFLLR